MIPEAKYWHRLEEGGKVQCELCPQECVIKPGGKGTCKNRGNQSGVLVPLLYGKAAAVHLDPIAKKPLYHFCPGSQILSIGFIGCNFHCPFCQNYSLVEGRAPLSEAGIEELIDEAKRAGSVGIAFTYNEPLVNFEWVVDCAAAFHKAGMRTAAVTNGYLNPKPFAEMADHIDAFNIDLKYASDENYRKYSGAKKPEAVRENIRLAYEKSHVEVTHLVVTDINDDEAEFVKLVDQIAEIGPDIPLHISAYSPMYKYHEPATSPEFLEKAYKLASRKLRYVYFGNVWSGLGSATFCSKCAAELVIRDGYRVMVVGLDGPRCKNCGAENYFVRPCEKK